jgi:hypothetical protein
VIQLHVSAPPDVLCALQEPGNVFQGFLNVPPNADLVLVSLLSVLPGAGLTHGLLLYALQELGSVSQGFLSVPPGAGLTHGLPLYVLQEPGSVFQEFLNVLPGAGLIHGLLLYALFKNLGVSLKDF